MMAQANALDAYRNLNTKLLEETKTEFYRQVDAYVDRIKVEILNGSGVAQAIEFLTQPVPDVPDSEPTQVAKQKADVNLLQDEIDTLKDEIQNLKAKMIKMKKKSERQIAKTELKTKKNTKKIFDMDTEQKEVIQVCSQRLAVIQNFLKDDLQVQQACGGAQGGATPGNSRPLTSFLPPSSASLQVSFSPKNFRDRWDVDIQDIALMPDGLIVAADGGNQCLKVFDFAGRSLHTHKTPGEFCAIAVMQDGHVAVIDRVSKTLEMLVISQITLTVQSSHKVTKSYLRIKATKANNLVASVARMVNFKWSISSEIDILDNSGALLRSLNAAGNIQRFSPTNDQGLIWTYINNIVKTDLTNGKELWRKQVPQTEGTGVFGVVVTRDGSVVVNSFKSKKLLLLSGGGDFIKELWQADGGDDSGALKNVFIVEDMCLLGTERKIFVLKLT